MPCGGVWTAAAAEHRSALLRTRICRRCSGEGSASYSLPAPPGRRDSGRFYGGVSKKRSIVSRGRAPGGNARTADIRQAVGAWVTSHSYPHFRNRNRVFSSAFTYGPTMITSSLRDFSPPTNLRGISAWFPRTLGTAVPRNRLPRPTPTPNRIRRIYGNPGEAFVCSDDRDFEIPRLQGTHEFRVIFLHHAIGLGERKSRHKPAPSVCDGSGTPGAPRPNARRRRQDPRRRPAGVSSGSPTSGGS